MEVRQVMTADVVTVGLDTTIKAAARLLSERRISAAPVVDASGRLLGIVSEADLIKLETQPDPRHQMTPVPPMAGPPPTTVAEVMTAHVVTAAEDTDLGSAAHLMIKGGVKRLPVVRDGRLVGIVSRHDLLQVLARDDSEIEAAVRIALAEEGPPIASVRVAVESGVAHLAGGDRRLLELAAVVARTVPGVIDVRTAPVAEA